MTRLKLPKPMTGAALKRWRMRQPSGFPGEACLTPEEAEAVFRFDKADGKGRSWRRWEGGTHPVPSWLQGLVGSPDAPWAKLTAEQVAKAADSVAVATVGEDARKALLWLARVGKASKLYATRPDAKGYRHWWAESASNGDEVRTFDGRTMRALEARGCIASTSAHEPLLGRRYTLTERGRLVAKS